MVTAFNALGEYDVTVSYGEKSASVKVAAVKYSFDSVEGAIALAGEKESFVASGEIVAASTSQYNPEDEVSRSSETINYLYGTSYVKVTATSDYGYGSYTYDPEYMVAYKDGMVRMHVLQLMYLKKVNHINLILNITLRRQRDLNMIYSEEQIIHMVQQDLLVHFTILRMMQRQVILLKALVNVLI